MGKIDKYRNEMAKSNSYTAFRNLISAASHWVVNFYSQAWEIFKQMPDLVCEMSPREVQEFYTRIRENLSDEYALEFLKTYAGKVQERISEMTEESSQLVKKLNGKGIKE